MNVILQRQYIYILTVQDLYDSYRRDCLKYLNECTFMPLYCHVAGTNNPDAIIPLHKLVRHEAITK